MPILLDTPIVITPEPKTYDGIWFTSIVSNSSPVDGYFRVESKPYNTTTGEIMPGDCDVFSTSDFWDVVNNVPEAEIAMSAMIEAIPKIKEYIANKTATSAENE